MTIVPADAAEVVSSNVVGYSKITMNADGYTLIANPFVEVGTGDLIGIDDMFADDTTGATGGTSASAADNILVWTGSGYETYYLRENKKAGTKFWVKGSTTATTDSLPEGGGAFYLNRAATAAELTMSGEVRNEPQTITIAANGYTLVENPFPTPLDIQTFNVEGAIAGTSAAAADNILVWTGSGYETYYLRENKKAGTKFWVKGSTTATTDTIAPYAGFFYQSRGNEAFTVTIQPPTSTVGQ